MMYTLLIVMTFFSGTGASLNATSVVVEYRNKTEADAAFDKVRSFGHNACEFTAYKLY